MTKAVVVGGAGLIGSHTVEELMRRGFEVKVIDALVEGSPQHIVDGAEFVHADVRSLTATHFKGADTIYHLAAIGGVFMDDPYMLSVNVVGTATVLDAAKAAGVRRVVYASSQAVYGPGQYMDCRSHGGKYDWSRTESDLRQHRWDPYCSACWEVHTPVALRESHPTSARTVYAKSKLLAEELVLSAKDIETIALRYALVYGPRQSRQNPYTGICSIFAQRARNGLRPIVYEDGLQTRDFTYVTDVARANVAASEMRIRWQRVFNIGTGVPTTVLDFAKMIAPDSEPLLSSEYRPDDARHMVTNTLLSQELKWRAEVPVEEGVKRYLEWFNRQDNVPDVTERAYARLKEEGVIV